jgi:hypothetical protein
VLADEHELRSRPADQGLSGSFGGNVVDHWWSLPLALHSAELGSAIEAANRKLDSSLAWVRQISTGRSGAAIHVLGRDGRPEVIMRVTSLRRALREKYAVCHLPSARHLQIGEDLPIVRVPSIHRPFDVTITLARFVNGGSIQYGSTLCPKFETLFETPSGTSRHDCPRVVVGLLTWLANEVPDIKHTINLALVKATGETWTRAIGHGDPTPSNVIDAESEGPVPVDFASGGQVARRLHRARWLHSVHGEGKEPLCECCAGAGQDRIALLADAARRLKSDGADRQRREYWVQRIKQLAEG